MTPSNANPVAESDIERGAYTVLEFRTRVIPMGHAQFYEDVKAGKLKTFKRGRRRYVPASERQDYPARLMAEAAE